MGEPRIFLPVKLISGIIAGNESLIASARILLEEIFGSADSESGIFPFNRTDYYAKEMGYPLHRCFISFKELVSPEDLARIKKRTNRLERRMSDAEGSDGRVVNIDPGMLRASSLIMATAKDFSHRVPLREGIYAHLELLFGKKEVRLLPWTYPDFQSAGYQEYFMSVRRLYLDQLRRRKRL